MTADPYNVQTRTRLAAIILNYNYARFVGDAIESVLNADPPFDEVIVVDDGSTDRSLEVIQKYKPRIKVITKENGGQLSASIAGISVATADYIYILDADDYVAPGFVRIARQHLADRPAKLQFQLIGVDVNRNPLGNTFPTYVTEYGAQEMVHDNRVIGFYVCPPTSGNLYRRDVLTGIKLHVMDPRDFIDGPPTLAMPYLGAVKSVNEPLAYYRAHGGSDSRWDRPDPRLLQGEINRFYRRWTDVCTLLDMDQPPFGADRPLYVLERELMQSALDLNDPVAGKVEPFLRRLLTAHFPAKQKLILIVWAIALLAPVVRWPHSAYVCG